MPDVLIRHVSENTLKRLKAAATLRHRSLQAELIEVLEHAAARDQKGGRAPRAEIRFDEMGVRAGTLARIERELLELRRQMDELKRSLPPIQAIGRAIR